MDIHKLRDFQENKRGEKKKSFPLQELPSSGAGCSRRLKTSKDGYGTRHS